MNDVTMKSGNPSRPSTETQKPDPQKTDSASAKPLQAVADKALAAGREIKDRASDFAETSVDTLKSQASDWVDASKDIASKAGERIQQNIAAQKGVGADYIGNFAQSMRRAAREFENDVPIASTYILKAASQVEMVSGAVKEGNFNDLVKGAQDFARRQPTAFLGLALLAGFGAVRFLKSSSAPTGSGHDEKYSGASDATSHTAALQGRNVASHRPEGGDRW